MRATLFPPKRLLKSQTSIPRGVILSRLRLLKSQASILMLITLAVSACSSTHSLSPNNNTDKDTATALTNKYEKTTSHKTTTTNVNSNQQTTQPKQHELLRIPLQCQKNVLTPAIFKTIERKLRTFEGSPAYTNIPATIEWNTVRFQTAPARFPHETVPATYREVTEKITTLRRRIEVVGEAAKYKIINKPVTTQEAYTGWKPGCAAPDSTQCIMRIPAKKQVIQQQFIDIPASVMQVARPEKTIEFTRKELVSPGQGYGKPIPAQYKEVKIGRVSKVWQLIAKQQPDRHATIPVQIKVRPERLRLTPSLCYEQATNTDLKLIQHHLRQHGYPVNNNGLADQQTLQAIIAFQKANQLPIGAITIETLRKLAEEAS